MSTEKLTLKQEYLSIQKNLNLLSDKLEEDIKASFNGILNIDKISFRVKTLDSFLKKSKKKIDSKDLKYKVPFREIQDIIGGRVVVYYKSNFNEIVKRIEETYGRVEKRSVVPDDESEFGYEGLHYILLIPLPIYNPFRDNPLIPYFFELQIKTLFQHAWSQSEHGLGYKPQNGLDKIVKRKLAFIAAQSWGADQILDELYNDSKT